MDGSLYLPWLSPDFAIYPSLQDEALIKAEELDREESLFTFKAAVS